jgi:hypothetical protein
MGGGARCTHCLDPPQIAPVKTVQGPVGRAWLSPFGPESAAVKRPSLRRGRCQSPASWRMVTSVAVAYLALTAA